MYFGKVCTVSHHRTQIPLRGLCLVSVMLDSQPIPVRDLQLLVSRQDLEIFNGSSRCESTRQSSSQSLNDLSDIIDLPSFPGFTTPRL